MKVKLLIAPSYREVEEKVNDFIKDKKVVDIKFQVNYVDDQDNYSVMVVYNE